MKKYNPEYLDKEEKELLKDIESIDSKKLKRPAKQEQVQMKKAAKEFMKQETKMNIRIDPFELEKIKEQAQKEGLRYQTFIKSVLHKYITGQLIERKIAG